MSDIEKKEVVNIKDAYKARLDAEQTGVWCDLLVGEIQIRATARNKEFLRLTKGIQSGQRINDDELFKKLAVAVGKTVVVDWSEEFGGDYSPDAFIALCEELREEGFLEDVLSLAMDREMFNQVAIAKTAKN